MISYGQFAEKEQCRQQRENLIIPVTAKGLTIPEKQGINAV